MKDLEQALARELSNVGKPADEIEVLKKEGGFKYPRVTIRLSCKKPGFDHPVEIVETTSQTMSVAVATIEAYKEATAKGYRQNECIILEVVRS